MSDRVYFRPSSVRIALLAALAALCVAAAPAARADVGEVMREIERHGQARVIITMRTGNGENRNAWAAARSVAQQRALVADASDRMERSMSAARIPVTRRFRTLPLAGLRVDREQLLKLAAMSDVTAVHLVRPERRHQSVSNTLERPSAANSVPSIDVPAAWSAGYDGTGLTIAVIDGSVNKTHPMLAGKVIAEACFADGDGATVLPSCPSGNTPEIGVGAGSNCPPGSTRCDHATHVASIAVGNDGINFGVAKGAKLLPIDVYSLYTDPQDCSPDPAPCELTNQLAVLNALDYVNDNAAELNIAAVNYSGGGGSVTGYCDDDPRKAVIDMLRAKGIAVTISAGNGGLTGQAERPSCISSAIAVGATNNGIDIADFSDFATTVDLMAPGVGIVAASGSGSGLVSKSGTSMAAPHVAGAWALLRAASPSATADQLEEALKATGTRVTRANAGFTVPRIQVMRAIDYLNGRSRKTFNQVVSSAATDRGRAYLRVFNNSDTAGVIVVTVRDVGTGGVLGKWTSALIPSRAAPQIAISTIESEISPSGVLGPPYTARPDYNLEIESSFDGYAQSVLWSTTAGVLADMTSCNSGLATTDGMLALNVHASSIADYVSHLRITNTGLLATAGKLTFLNAKTGAQVATWTSVTIPSGASVDIKMADLEAASPALANETVAGTSQYNVILSGLTGYLQHVLESRQLGVTTNMTGKCALAASAVVTVPPPITASN